MWTNFTKFRPFPPGLYSKERESKSFFRKWAVALLRVFLQTAASDRDAIKPLLAICFRTGLPLLDLFRFLCPLMMHDICYYFNNRHLAYATDVVQVHLWHHNYVVSNCFDILIKSINYKNDIEAKSLICIPPCSSGSELIENIEVHILVLVTKADKSKQTRKIGTTHSLRLDTKRTAQILRVSHVYSIDNFVAFWLKWL